MKHRLRPMQRPPKFNGTGASACSHDAYQMFVQIMPRDAGWVYHPTQSYFRKNGTGRVMLIRAAGRTTLWLDYDPGRRQEFRSKLLALA